MTKGENMVCTGIVMREGRRCSYNPLDIEFLIIDNKKVDIEATWAMLTPSEHNSHPPIISIDGHENAVLEPWISMNGKHYIRSVEVDTELLDNSLLELPRK